MKKKQIKFEFDRDVDAAYLTLTKEKVLQSEEVFPGIVVDYDAMKRIVGVEILHITKRFKPLIKAK